MGKHSVLEASMCCEEARGLVCLHAVVHIYVQDSAGPE